MANLTQDDIVSLFGRDAILVPYAGLQTVEKDFSVLVQISIDSADEKPYSIGAVQQLG